MAEILLVINALIYIVLELSIIIKAVKMPKPADYPPKSWDWFQRWVETKWFWLELILFLGICSLIAWILCR